MIKLVTKAVMVTQPNEVPSSARQIGNCKFLISTIEVHNLSVSGQPRYFQPVINGFCHDVC